MEGSRSCRALWSFLIGYRVYSLEVKSSLVMPLVWAGFPAILRAALLPPSPEGPTGFPWPDIIYECVYINFPVSLQSTMETSYWRPLRFLTHPHQKQNNHKQTWMLPFSSREKPQGVIIIMLPVFHKYFQNITVKILQMLSISNWSNW